MSPTLRLLLLAALVSLSGCKGDDRPSQQLLSVTVTNAEGQATALTRLDYHETGLFRVRSYAEPGDDGQLGTSDDPLYQNAYARCEIETSSPMLLHDAFAEQHDNNRTERLFHPLTSCALPGLAASSVKTVRYTGPGQDGQWFTFDDSLTSTTLLVRTTTGSERTETLERVENSSCTLNCSGLNNVVYNPYAGLDSTPRVQAIAYRTDASGHVTRLRSSGYDQYYEYDAANFITLREVVSTTTPAPGASPLPIYRARDEYARRPDGLVAVTAYGLTDSAIFASIAGSPTGQLLLEILGLGSAGEITLDGVVYSKVGMRHYRIDTSHPDLQTVTQLTGTGPDEQWQTADDIIGATATLRFGTPP